MAEQKMEPEKVSRTWLNPIQLSDYIGIERSTIYQYVRELRIPYHKVPGSQLLRFRRDDIDAWMATGRVETAEDHLNNQGERNGNGEVEEAEGSRQ